MEKRVIVTFSVMIFLFSCMMFRVYSLTNSNELAEVARSQSSYTLDIGKTRGGVYDCNFLPLLDTTASTIAAIMPCPQALDTVAKNLKGVERSIALEQMKQKMPFVIPLQGQMLQGYGINTFELPKRYAENQLAPHLLGYCDGWSGDGVSGIEKAYNSFLRQVGGELSVTYQVDAFKNPLVGEEPVVKGESGTPTAGVVLTLDKEIQQIATDAGETAIEKGAIVVMDVNTGELKAVASFPQFDPNHVENYLDDPNQPLYNRAFGAYSVGSSFKLAVAATALEVGISPDFAHYCNGSIEVNGINFSCNYKEGHGWVTMNRAVEQSCNPYFISLGQNIAPQDLLFVAQEMGLGKASELAPGLFSDAGTLDSPANLENLAERANFSFGQGKLTATPVQIAQMVSCIANGGKSVVPQLVKGQTLDGVSLAEEIPAYATNQVLREETAQTVRQFMINVVEKGSGVKGKPEQLGAGGKTSSAQTGRFTGAEEQVEAWFVGFYPAEQPQYAIVVFVEGGKYGGDVASPIFKSIADGIYKSGKIWELQREEP